MATYLEVKNIEKSFDQHPVLKKVSLSIPKGQFVCILGPSGCGKTTLLRIIAGLESPESGSILLNGKEVIHLPTSKRKVGIVFQSYALFPNMSVAKNIAYGLENKHLKKAVIEQKVSTVLELVGLPQKKNALPRELSGGQQQRVAIARALVMEPEILLLDEPLSALDAKVREKLRNQLKTIQKKLGITAIMVTHDQEEALTLADHMIVMKDAEIMQTGTPIEIYRAPSNPFVADFIGTMNFWQEPQQLCGIRPEHLKINAAGDFTGEVLEQEYRGSFFRLKIKITSPETTLFDQILAVDLSINEVLHSEVKVGQIIKMSLKACDILAYPLAKELA